MRYFFIAADCDTGEYLNETSNTCQKCDIGYYQDIDWRTDNMKPHITMCKMCPTGTSTDDIGKKSVTACNSKFLSIAQLFIWCYLFTLWYVLKSSTLHCTSGKQNITLSSNFRIVRFGTGGYQWYLLTMPERLV